MKNKVWGGVAAGAAALVVVGGVFVAQTTRNNASAKDAITGTITVLTNRTDMQANGMLKKYAQEFEKKYPGTHVQWQTFVDTSTVQAQMNGGVYPDVMLVLPNITRDQLPTYFAPLDDLGLDNKIYLKDWDSYQGKVYGIPSFANVNGIVYNKAAFRKAGITQPPKTLNEFYQDCAKLKKAGIIPIEMNYTDKWPLSNWSNSLPDLIAKDANYMNTLVKSNAPFSTNTPEGQALAIARKIIENGWAEKDWKNTNWANSKVLLAKGKAAMMFLGNWAVPQIIADGAPSKDVGFFPFPASNDGKNVAIMGPDWCYAVNKHSKHIATAKAFVKWMLLDSGFANYAGGIPIIKGQKSNVPQLAEFQKLTWKTLTAVPDSDKLTKLENAAQIDITGGGATQTVLNAPSLQAAFKQLNQAWANAKSMLGY
ncbi:sugar ABC transporter substrate-binding protein [Alicyclobacillus cellulosilyticus]|uniref:Sugar ABC transporter substrate-binding protein n=1 Tax=Alicyclobacillus cellulosilyticus TaxID=1003997 RepID=A0A917NGY8_9BACL|nr:ABC transporter substrate-binding protein [Alicyclobacillus cellulosilyticus]GGJ00347.1 sugar ABC transporter substrate-binding protein [Alicyclobacillus cellulosilyticus]